MALPFTNRIALSYFHPYPSYLHTIVLSYFHTFILAYFRTCILSYFFKNLFMGEIFIMGAMLLIGRASLLAVGWDKLYLVFARKQDVCLVRGEIRVPNAPPHQHWLSPWKNLNRECSAGELHMGPVYQNLFYYHCKVESLSETLLTMIIIMPIMLG